jgi:hypothetical protein
MPIAQSRERREQSIPSHPLFIIALALGACGGTTSQSTDGTTSRSTPPQPPPWSVDSISIDVTCGSFSGGSMRFRADRSQLSETQLSMLARMTVIQPKGACGEDGTECSIVVTQTDNRASNFASGDDGCEGTPPRIAFDMFDPFLQTIGCRYSKDDFWLSPGATPAPVDPDPRCYNGLFVGTGTTTLSVGLKADAPGTRHVELDACDGPNQVGKLNATLGTMPPESLATIPAASGGADGACASLDATFSVAGTYTLSLAIAPDFLPLGDLWLRFY